MPHQPSHTVSSYPSENRLAQARRRRGWTQAMVAEAIGATEVSVGRWERAVAVPSLYYRQKLCELFEMNARALGVQSQQEVPRASFRDPFLPLWKESGEGKHPFYGRGEIQTHIIQSLQTGGVHALFGLPGVGKTTLALAVAYDTRIRAHFDGILWASLGRTPDIGQVVSRWSCFLERCEQEEEEAEKQQQKPEQWDGYERAIHLPTGKSAVEWAKKVYQQLAHKRVLLLLDDVWEVEHAIALRMDLPAGAFLLTTRSPLVAATFAANHAILVPELSTSDGVAVCTHFVPELRSSYRKQTEAIVRAVGGLPLALTLIGHYVRRQSYSSNPGYRSYRLEVALKEVEQSEQRLHLRIVAPLTEQLVQIPEGTWPSLQSIIDLSIRHLDPVAQAVLSALALFPAKPTSFSEEMALWVSGCSKQVLDHLLDSGLLESDSFGRFMLHQTVRDVVSRRLHDEAMRERFMLGALNYIGKYQTSYHKLAVEYPWLMSALHMAYRYGYQEQFVQGVQSLVAFHAVRGSAHVVFPFLQAARKMVSTSQVERRFVLLLWEARLSELCGRWQQAAQCLQEAEQWALETCFASSTWRVRVLRGLNLARAGMQAEALARLQSLWQERTEVPGEERWYVTLLLNMGWLAQNMGNVNFALECYQQVFTYADEKQDQGALALGGLLQGEIVLQQGHYEQAGTILRRAWDASMQKEQCDPWLAQDGQPTLERMGEEKLAALQKVGSAHGDESSGALRSFELEQEIQKIYRGLPLLLSLGQFELQGRLASAIAVIAVRQGHDEEAERWYRQALGTAYRLEDRHQMVLLLFALGEACSRQEKWRKARAAYRQVKELARRMGWREEECRAILKLAMVALEQEFLDEVFVHLQAGKELALQVGEKRLHCQALFLLALGHFEKLEVEVSEQLLQKLQEEAGATMPDLLAGVQYGKARLLAYRGEYEEAIAMAKVALAMLERLEHPLAKRVRCWISAQGDLPVVGERS